MIGASFNSVGKQTMDLTELKVTGYENAEYFEGEGGVFGMFELRVLNAFGGVATDKAGYEKDYYYFHIKNEDSGKYEPNEYYWLQNGFEDPIEKGAVTFDVGEGLWFDVFADAYVSKEENYTLLNAGEALLDARSVLLRAGSKGVVAPLSASVDLTKIKISGYENAEYFEGEGGVFGMFELRVLNEFGGVALDDAKNEKDYYYFHIKNEDSGKYELGEQYWLQNGFEDPIEKGAVVFEMGEGLWVDVFADAYVNDEKYYMDFPGIDELAD